MKALRNVDGYLLEDVAKEIAQVYGGEVNNWKVQDGKLIVEYDEHGEFGVSELPLSEVKSFMEM